jgi:hypothetical protein
VNLTGGKGHSVAASLSPSAPGSQIIFHGLQNARIPQDPVYLRAADVDLFVTVPKANLLAAAKSVQGNELNELVRIAFDGVASCSGRYCVEEVSAWALERDEVLHWGRDQGPHVAVDIFVVQFAGGEDTKIGEASEDRRCGHQERRRVLRRICHLPGLIAVGKAP